MTRLAELAAANHPYYCHTSNYYSNDAVMHFTTMTEFLDTFEDADIDMNLCFRWDIYGPDEETSRKQYRAEVFLMLQRKGIFKPCVISSIEEHEVERFESYLKVHAEVLKDIWRPIL